MKAFAESPLFRSLPNKDIQCLCCQHKCVISPGKLGRCRARGNVDGKPYQPTWGRFTVAVDPIEKKPLYHFLPGTKVYSYGTVGCNFSCQFCQNSSLSMWKLDLEDVKCMKKSDIGVLEQYTPQEMVAAALKTGCKSIASTYNEPTITSEFSHEVFMLAKSKGLHTVYVTNGFESVETLNYLAPYLDAVNIDLKSFREKFYMEVCGAHMTAVCDTIRRCVAMGIHTEVTTLVIPGANDSDEELRDIAQFLASIDREIVWHVSAYHDDYKFFGRGVTPVSTLERAVRIGREAGLVYIYMGNVSGGDSHLTKCPNCGKQLIWRDWGSARIFMKGGKCTCGVVVPGLFQDAVHLKPKVESVPQELVEIPVTPVSVDPAVQDVVFYATKGGTSKRFAEEIGQRLGFPVEDIANLSVDRLASTLRRVVFAVATYGRGKPPPSAVDFWQEMSTVSEWKGGPLQFAVLGCGSSAFSKTFVGFAKDLDAKLKSLGLTEIAPMCTRDENEDDDDDKVREWITGLKFP